MIQTFKLTVRHKIMRTWFSHMKLTRIAIINCIITRICSISCTFFKKLNIHASAQKSIDNKYGYQRHQYYDNLSQTALRNRIVTIIQERGGAKLRVVSPTAKIKQHWAWAVLGWVTIWLQILHKPPTCSLGKESWLLISYSFGWEYKPMSNLSAHAQNHTWK